MTAEEEYNEDFNLRIGDGRRVGVPDSGLREREELFFGSDFSHRAHDETTGQQSGRSKVSSSAERCRPRRIASNL